MPYIGESYKNRIDSATRSAHANRVLGKLASQGSTLPKLFRFMREGEKRNPCLTGQHSAESFQICEGGLGKPCLTGQHLPENLRYEG